VILPTLTLLEKPAQNECSCSIFEHIALTVDEVGEFDEIEFECSKVEHLAASTKTRISVRSWLPGPKCG
jgi:hypothetical protein